MPRPDPESRGARPLTGRTALVTGAGRRVGRAIALGLADAGARVAVHYNGSAGAAESVRAEIEERGVEAATFQADLSDTDSAPGLVDRVWAWAGTLDLLVNNASIFPGGRLADLRFEDVVANLTVNAWSPFALTRALWRRAVDAGTEASVVNLLDSRLVGGDPLHAAYFLSKRALAELTRACALDFAPALRVNGVAPGPILSPEGEDEDYLRQRLDALPLRRWGGPEQIAGAVVYLATASFVTGQTVFVDGGQHLDPWGASP